MAAKNAFLDGNVLVPISLPTDWIVALDRIIPGTTDGLNELLTDARLDLETLLSAPHNPSIVVNKIVIPIILINELKYAIAVYEYQLNPFNAQVYFDMVDNIHSIFDQYSIAYYNGGIGKLLVY